MNNFKGMYDTTKKSYLSDRTFVRLPREKIKFHGNTEEERKMQKLVNDNVLAIVEKFCEMGHSGFTAGYEINLIIRALRQQPLTKLTLEDNEFIEVADGVFQNKRDGRVFKQKDRFDGKPYNVDTKQLYDAERGE